MAPKKKTQCPIESAGIEYIDYKDTVFLKKYLTKFNRIIPRYYSGVSLRNQKRLARAIKRARYMALLPYVLTYRAPAIEARKILPESAHTDEKTLDETTTAI
jgi:small subunit ribosomal protein S18